MDSIAAVLPVLWLGLGFSSLPGLLDVWPNLPVWGALLAMLGGPVSLLVRQCLR